MMVTVDYGNFIGSPSDIAALIELSERLVKVDHSKDYSSMHVDAEQKSLIISVGFAKVTERPNAIVEPEQPNAAIPNVMEPAPARALQDFDQWLTEVRAMQHAIGDDDEFRARWERGMSPADAADDSVPF